MANSSKHILHFYAEIDLVYSLTSIILCTRSINHHKKDQFEVINESRKPPSYSLKDALLSLIVMKISVPPASFVMHSTNTRCFPEEFYSICREILTFGLTEVIFSYDRATIIYEYTFMYHLKTKSAGSCM